MFSLERGRLQGDLIAAFHYLKGAYKHEGKELFTWVGNERDKGDGRFILDVKAKFFTERMVRCWYRLPREVVDVLSLEVFKARLDGPLGSLV